MLKPWAHLWLAARTWQNYSRLEIEVDPPDAGGGASGHGRALRRRHRARVPDH